jgi:O-antigen ligase
VKLRDTLLVWLAFAVLTVWVRERWALAALEGGVFLVTGVMLGQAALGRRALSAGIAAVAVGLVCLWAVLQWAFRWAAVRADTYEACLYWLTAACLVLLGRNACAEPADRDRFLKGALITGSAVCFLGILQLFTSAGRIFWLFPSGYETQVIGPFVNPNNYAAFVELLVPVALALAFRNEARTGAYLMVAAALAASVVAGGSRAGTIVVALECLAAFLLRPRKWLTFGVLAAAFTALVGYQFLWDRFRSDQDPYLVRREFLQSSVAMFRAQPWHGFGMGNWPAVYPRFAVIDSGTVANHAHNEWAQWAAEGGLPVLLLMAGVLVWAVRPALRSIWGLGILAVLVHSWVDYPFLRLGLAAWIFALLGVLSAAGGRRFALPPIPARVLAGAAVPALAVGIVAVVRIACADALYHRGTPDSLSRAAALRPEKAEYQVDLSRALALNPYLTRARIALAAEQEARGEMAAAEATLLEAARRDRQFLPAWAMANFYFRNRPDRFWPWARAASAMAYADMSPLFDLCFHTGSDARTVLERVVAGRRFAEREYLAYLTRLSRLQDAHAAALRIARTAGAADREALLHYVDRSLRASRAQAALEVWNSLCLRRLVPYRAALAGTLVNGDFGQPMLNRGFDWMERPATGVMLFQSSAGGAELEIALSGKQPERCEILAHYVPVAPRSAYRLRFEYRTAELPKHTGVIWSVDPRQEFELAAAPEWSPGEWRFEAPADATRLVLAYRRAPGTTRREGAVFLRQVQLKESL